MADAIQLRQGELPPETEGWVLITLLPSGKYEVSSSFQVGPDAAKFGFSEGISKPLSAVIEMASEYATHASDAKVYLHWNVNADRT